MKQKRKSLLRFVALGMLLISGLPITNAQTPQEIAKKALDATVLLATEDANGKFLGLGSGFFVHPNLIATNFHVIDGATRGVAKRVGLKTIYEIEAFTAIDKKNDLAILRVSAPGIKPLPLGDSKKVEIAEKVYVAGNPRGYLEGTFSDGIISGIREIGIDELPDKLIQITAPISEGSSGGPVLNTKGEVIGVSMSYIREGQNLNFAIPSNYLKLLISGLPITNAQTPQEIAKKALDATVLLVMVDAKGEIFGFGSGFFVHPNLIATNFHVIEGATRGGAKRVGLETIYEIEAFTAIDKKNDLAILRVSAPGVKPLPLGDSDKVEIGEKVYVAGNPRGYLEGTFSDGIISGFRRRVTNKRIQITAPISQGSSGGPVLNANGEVIGVSVAIFGDGQNLNFAIPSNYLKALVPQLKSTKSVPKRKPPPPKKKSLSSRADPPSQKATSPVPEVKRPSPKAKPSVPKELPPLPEKEPSLSADAHFARGTKKAAADDHKGAIADFDAAIRLKPDYADAYLSRGNVWASLEQYFAAITDYNKAIELKPDYTDVYINRGMARDHLGQHTAAISDYNTAIRLDPDNSLVYNCRGMAKRNLKQYLAAIADYDKAIARKEDYAKAYVNRGIAKADLEQHAAAIFDYNRAIKYNPNYGDAYYNRGVARTELRQYADAINDFNTAINLKPDYANAYLNRGNVRYKLKQYVTAVTNYDNAIRLKPDDADAYYNRGLAKYKLGRTLEAKRDFQIALKLAKQAGDTRLKALIEKMLLQRN